MPVRASELQKRVVTGVLGGFSLVALIWFGGRFGVSVFAVVLSLVMQWEFLGIILNLPDQPEKRWVLLSTTWIVAFINFWMPRTEFELYVICFMGLFTYFLVTSRRHVGDEFEKHFREFVYSMFGLFYLTFIPLYLPLLSDSGYSVHWTILFLLIVWGGDSGAYFAGSFYGKRKMFPSISPNKTWEGFAGGLSSGLVISIIYKLLVFQKMTWWATIVTPLMVGSVAPVGDLAESFLKRAYHLKDSGKLIPGHGGVLDRFDAVLFGLPIMYACVRVFG